MCRASRLLSVLAVALLPAAVAAQDQDAPDPAREAALEREIAELEQRLAAARAELARLRAAAPATPAPAPAGEDAVPAHGAPAAARSADAVAEARASVTRRQPFSSELVATALVPDASEPSHALARAAVSEAALQLLLGARLSEALDPAARARVLAEVRTSLREEELSARPRGGVRYAAVASADEVLAAAAHTLGLAGALGDGQLVVVDASPGGPHAGLDVACRERLLRLPLRLTASTAAREAAARAAASLGAEPDAQLGELVNLFEGRYLLLVRASVRYEAFASGSPQSNLYSGALACEGSATLLDREEGRLLAVFPLRSERDAREPRAEATPGALHGPWVSRQETVAAARADYARAIGHVVGEAAARRLLEVAYGRAVGGEVGRRLLTRPAGPDDFYSLRLSGWSAPEVERILAALRANPDFDDWRERGRVGEIEVWECSFVGSYVIKQLREALARAGLAEQAKVTKDREGLNVLRLPR